MFLAPLALTAALATSDAAIIDAIFARWEAAARDLKLLHVEYEVSRTCPQLKREESWEQSVRLLRTESGLLGILDVRQGGVLAKRFLLRDGTITEIDPVRKTQRRFQPSDLTQLVTDYMHPLFVVLDRERMRQAYSVEVEKRDSHFTYLSFTPRDDKSDRPAGRVVVVHRKNTDLPVGAPRVVVYTHPDETIRYDITRWAVNGDSPSKAEQFAHPAKK